MKIFDDIQTITIDQIRALAVQAPAEPEKAKNKAYAGSDRTEKSQSRSSQRPDLGAVDIEKYLQNYGVEYSVKTSGDKTIYNLQHCVFDPSHSNKEASIIQDSKGLITYQCFHNSCHGRTWAEARQTISGDDSLAPFCAGYDPNWRPPARTSRSLQSKDQDKKSESDAENKNETSKNDDFITFSARGRPTFNVSVMSDHLEEHFNPIIYEGKDYTKQFYRYHKSGVWKFFPEAAIRKYVREKLGHYATPEHISRAVNLFQDQVFKMPRELEFDPMILNVKNGMLDLRTMELSQHAPEYMSRAQLPVSYNPEAKCRMWINKLAEIFIDDLHKPDVLQEFFGYCLYPKIVFPCALFQIGVGGNGKGLVERICYSILGKDNVSHVSMARMAKDFGPIEIRDKLLNSCGETETSQMDVTNFKKIASGDEIQAEVKYQNDVKFTPVAKHLISMNDFPGIKDKTDAFFRRIIVLEYNQKFEGKDMDPYLADKLMAELDGIFMWALEGLKRVLEQKCIHIPESVLQAKMRFRAKVNPVILFVSEECQLGENFMVNPPRLYDRYKKWAEDAKLKALGKTNFYENILLNCKGVLRRRPTDMTTEVFQGIGLNAVTDL